MATYRLERLFTDPQQNNQNNSNRRNRRNNNQQQNNNNHSNQGQSNKSGNNQHSNQHNNQHGSNNQQGGKTNNASQRKLVEIDTKKVLKRAGVGLAAAGLVAGGTYGVYKLAEKIDKNKENTRKDRSRNRMVRGLNLDTPTHNK